MVEDHIRDTMNSSIESDEANSRLEKGHNHSVHSDSHVHGSANAVEQNLTRNSLRIMALNLKSILFLSRKKGSPAKKVNQIIISQQF
jgi:hypothetical protein